MALITNGELTVIMDKLARFATESVGDPEFNAGFNAGMALASGDVLSGAGGIATYLLTLNDEDVEADLLPAARDLDENHPTLPDSVLIQITGISSMLKAIDTHLKKFSTSTTLDAYLTVLNASVPTLRAHGHFRKYLKGVSAKNSFIPNDMVLGTFAETGSTTGTFTHVNTIDKTQYAGAKLVIKNVTALTSSPVVTVNAKKLDGTTVSLTATLSTHTINTETDLSDTTKLYVDVTSISIASGGTNAESFSVIAKTDRSIAAA